MKIQDLNKGKIPLVRINKILDKYKGKILFQEKSDMANKLLSRVKLPDFEMERK